MPAKSWHKAIPVLRELIKDEIQGKLLQQCVFIRIDGTPHGDPINVLEDDDLMVVMSAVDNFGGVDSSCYTLVLKEYSELIEKLGANMLIQGDNNVQISSKDNATLAIGAGSMAAGRDVVYGVSPSEVAKMLTERDVKYKLLEIELDKIKESNQKEIQKIAAEKAIQIYEKMKIEQKTNFNPREVN